MADKTQETPADMFYLEGMKYDWRQAQSPAAATLARANFHHAATMGHTKAIRALAHMIFDGSGGAQDREHALLLLWSTFLRGDNEALEEIVDMLETYAETTEEPATGKDATVAARRVEELNERLEQVGNFMRALAMKRSARNEIN